MRQLKTHLITMKNVLFGSDFISKFCYIYSVYKNYQILSLHLSNVSYSSPQTPSCNHIWLLQKPMHPYFFCIVPWHCSNRTRVLNRELQSCSSQQNHIKLCILLASNYLQDCINMLTVSLIWNGRISVNIVANKAHQ